MSIKKQAALSASKSRKCATCTLSSGGELSNNNRCTPEICDICFESHVEGFINGSKSQINKSAEKEIVKLFDKLYGRSRIERLIKLEEELQELLHEVRLYLADEDTTAEIHDEMSDVVAVISHVASIFGTDINKLLLQAHDKVQGRRKDHNYKRKHPHETA